MRFVVSFCSFFRPTSSEMNPNKFFLTASTQNQKIMLMGASEPPNATRRAFLPL